jgi:hypothetical protein
MLPDQGSTLPVEPGTTEGERSMRTEGERSMRSVILSTILAAVAVFALACGQESTSTPQEISGNVSQDTFPGPVTAVRVVSGTAVVNEAQVDASDAFTLVVPPGKGYRIEFLGDSNSAGLVFPRSAGGIETKFDVAASQSPFDMGAVRYIGDPMTRNYLYSNLQDENGDGECGQEGEFEGENEDVCVDDEAEDEACEEDEDGEEDDDDIECEDGVDSNTGLPCENDDDGEVEDELSSDAAVAERNLPSSVGCEDEDDDDVECEQEGEHEGENEGC